MNEPSEQLLYHLVRQKSASHPLTKILPNFYQYPPGSIRKVSRHDVQYELDISDYIEWAVYYDIHIDAKSHFYKMIKKDDVVFDIGANIGEFTFQCAKIVGRNGAIHSFEPNEKVFYKLKKNYEINPFKNIYLNKVALGEKHEYAYLHVPYLRNYGGATISPVATTHADKIAIIPLDYYIEHHAIKQVNVIKIDVEGYELKVLKGAQHTLRTYKPTLLLEFSDKLMQQHKDTPAALIQYLKSLGYHNIVEATTHKKIHPDICQHSFHFDIIAY